MKKSLSIALVGAAAAVTFGALYSLMPSPDAEQPLAQAALESNPYMTFLTEEQKQQVRDSFAASKQDGGIAREPQVDEANGAAVEDIPEMSPELMSYIANAQPEKIMEFFALARKERAETIQAMMRDEDENPEWKDEMLQYFTLSETLAPQMKGVTLLNADCRESVCALQVDYGQYIKNYQDIEPFLSNIGNLVGLDAWVHHDALPHGGVIYFARENTALPEMRKI
ncbi:hypothetical protein [Ketobacter sp.]|uniref:hypothetical protein n=1 Tax=Ketobacter sp. TaxID=2083498 RepID=UPI000F2CB3AC|nr:hypothetical protein [Ketobacter sp.]RLU00138.1 MAG: hypothetical protein D9N14_06500 [Ketobacter sp.]